MPHPINNYVVKVHSRCNLDCSYCYEYNRGNTGWKTKPREMTINVFRKMCSRIREHAIKHDLKSVSLSLHGGEPLLRKPSFFKEAAQIVKEIISPICECNLGVQTNAVLLSSEYLDVFLANEIRVGVSLDGPSEVNDKYRTYKSGRGSYKRARSGIEKLLEAPYYEIWGGVLAVIDVNSDPVLVYQHLAALSPPTIDFLEPDGSWDRLPDGKNHPDTTEYGDWLIAVFDEWFSGNQNVKLRKFEEIIQRLLGGHGDMEYFGLEPVSLLVVATDGSYESVDQIKSVKDGIERTGLDVFNNEIDDVLELDLIRARQLGLDGISSKCVECEFSTSCGGGYFPHRYSESNQFINPSIYCADYYKLFSHIKNVLIKDVGIELRSKGIA